MKSALCLLAGIALSACVQARQVDFMRVQSVKMEGSDAFVILVEEGSRTFRLWTLRAAITIIKVDVPAIGWIWVEYTGIPGEWPEKGDTLTIHVRTLQDVFHHDLTRE